MTRETGRRKARSVAQAPGPLPVPENWSQEERRLIAQLNTILADIYRRWGRLGLSDFSVALRQAFDRKVTVDAFESAFIQTAQSLSVQFGTPHELIGPTLEISADRLYAKVRSVAFELTDAAGNVVGTVRAEGNRLAVHTLTARDVVCDRLLRRDEVYDTLRTQEKTVLHAINELTFSIDDLSERLKALESTEEE